MALTLQAVPRYCVDCANFRVLTDQGDPRYGRCYSPCAPMVGAMNSGEEYISAAVAEEARPFASSMRRAPESCGPDGNWFVVKPAPSATDG